MENKIYYISCTSGSYDDWNKFTVATCSNSTIADELKKKFIAQVKEFKTRYTFEEQNILENEMQIEFDNNNGDIRPDNKRLNDYYKWKYGEDLKTSLHINDDSCEIEEIELDKIVYKFE